MSIKNDLWDFKFEQVNQSSFELEMTVRVKTQLMNNALTEAMRSKKLAHVVGADKGEKKKVDNFVVPSVYNGTLVTACNTGLKDIKRQVGEDGIKVLGFDYSSAYFEKAKGYWLCHVFFTGKFIKE